MFPSDLNPAQWEAVNCLEGPLLVLAGPGSGKTRVITRRIARMVESGVWPSRILAITFTNKAASEMESRVEKLLPGTRVWVSTFHRLCARLLRKYAPAVGLQPNFTIFDTSDQAVLMREVLSEQDIDPKHYAPGKLLHRIGQAKHRMETAEMFRRHVEEVSGSFLDQVTSRVYGAYQKALLNSNAVDFDDLLLHVCRLLDENDEIRAELDDRFRYILVDEYQDTNLAQYHIIRSLSRDFPNLCATGDPDQSIYGWRGAEIGNILRFEHDFPDARVVRLEQNYRSTQSILKAADKLIAHNTRRKAKSLFTDNAAGEPVELLCFEDQAHEAEGIALTIRRLADEENREWSDFAVFYRINALSRGLELALARHKIPYQVAAGVAFYERAEVKDVLGYLRLIHNPADRAAFLRVVNTPARGIGKSTVSKLVGWADQQGIGALDAARNAQQFPGLGKRAVVALRRFAELIDEFTNGSYGGVAPLIEAVLRRTGYGSEWRDSRAESDLQRVANIDELTTAARQYDQEHADDPTLEGFLESASLVADVDAVDEHSGKVTLMTLHAAKGLEFPVVLIAAVEEGMLPHDRAIKDDSLHEMEEERRLLFVGVTRAEERLFLTQTWVRDFRGSRFLTTPSRFLHELEFVRGETPTPFGLPRFPAEVGTEEPVDASDDSEAAPAAWAGTFEQPKSRGGAPPFHDRASARPPKKLGGPLLTTAAELLNGSVASSDESVHFVVGMSVRHPRLGLGTVVETQGTGRWRTVTVEFQPGEPKKFVAHKCPLQPVGVP